MPKKGQKMPKILFFGLFWPLLAFFDIIFFSKTTYLDSCGHKLSNEVLHDILSIILKKNVFGGPLFFNWGRVTDTPAVPMITARFSKLFVLWKAVEIRQFLNHI